MSSSAACSMRAHLCDDALAASLQEPFARNRAGGSELHGGHLCAGLVTIEASSAAV